jgi:GntR family transcriptional regulator
MSVALYRKIAGELRERVIGGELRPGDRLPTEPQLMERYSCGRNTVRLAVALLVNEGLVERIAGRAGGMVVRERVTLTYHASRAELPGGLWPETDAWFGEVAAQGYEPSQAFETRIEMLSAELAERLGVDADSEAALRRCIRSVNGEPSSIQDTYYPQDLCDEVPELRSARDIPQGTTRLLADRGYPQLAVADEITAMMPAPVHVALLNLPLGTPVLHYIRTGYAATRPVRVSVHILRGDSNRLVYTLGDAGAIRRHQGREDE